jgi:hypothetical protein
MGFGGQKQVGGCSVKVVVVVQEIWDEVGTDPLVVLVVVEGEASLERDVAANRRARAQDRDSFYFPDGLLC